MAKYWIGVASREHVMRGVVGGVCQVCHGKDGPLRQMQGGDWIVYYSPTERFGERGPCRKFTAIGRIEEGTLYQVTMEGGFTPWRRKVGFLEAKEAPISSLIAELSFIRDKSRWGFPFRRGCFAIHLIDFQLIAAAMDVTV